MEYVAIWDQDGGGWHNYLIWKGYKFWTRYHPPTLSGDKLTDKQYAKLHIKGAGEGWSYSRLYKKLQEKAELYDHHEWVYNKTLYKSALLGLEALLKTETESVRTDVEGRDQSEPSQKTDAT